MCFAETCGATGRHTDITSVRDARQSRVSAGPGRAEQYLSIVLNAGRNSVKEHNEPSGVIRVLTTNGDNHLGGDDFDQ